MHPENQFRAERILCAATAVKAYRDNMEEPDQLAADLLADLRHFCDLHGLIFEKMNARGHEVYLDEIQEPQQ